MKGMLADIFRVVMGMVQGYLVHGFRTRAEQTALMQDMNASVVNKTLDVRPEWLQVPFARLAATLDQLVADPTVHAVVFCSCPSRIDNDTTVMQQVRDMARGQPKLLLTFRYAGNAASTLLCPF